jgi:hypothetical protein
MAALGVGLLLAIAIARLGAEGRPAESGVALTIAALGAAAGAALLVVLFRTRKGQRLGIAASTMTAGFAVVLIALFLFTIARAVFLPADILIWSEGPFVNDIHKFRLGRPLYGPPADLSTFFYTPGSQLLSYGLASLVGKGTSIPALRIVQLMFAALAALACTLSVRKLIRLTKLEVSAFPVWLLSAFVTSFLFLAATNPQTNRFVYLLHNDSLAVLFSAVAFLLLVDYAERRTIGGLVALALMPAVGFLIKQSLAGWAGLIGLYLLLFDAPRSFRRIAGFAVGAGAALAATFAAAQLMWGPYFRFWVVEVLRDHPFSVLRSIQHGITGWVWYAAAFLAAAVLANRFDRRVYGLWVVSLLMLAQGTYTSGIAWMLNHMGPGSLLVSIWLCLALVVHLNRLFTATPDFWLATGVRMALPVLALVGLGFVRVPVPTLPSDVERYVADIERAMSGIEKERVMLDGGTWTWLSTNVVPRDMGAPVGDLGVSGTGDFSGFLERINTRHYKRVLVRSLHANDFMYDHYLWPRSSGIRDALLKNYREVLVIPAVEGHDDGNPFLQAISVLEPREAP